MKRRCVGFVRPVGSTNGWLRCESRALNGDRLCEMHRDALDGAFLGLLGGHSVCRDDKHTETQAAVAPPQNGARSEDTARSRGLDSFSGDGYYHAASSARGQRHREKISNTQARAHWRRAAEKRCG
jgi:hypothetical protein